MDDQQDGYFSPEAELFRRIYEEIRNSGKEFLSVVDPVAYGKMMESIERIGTIITNAMKKLEFDGEECGAEFQFSQPKPPFALGYGFTVLLPNYGVCLSAEDIAGISDTLPPDSTVDISPTYDGDKVRIHIVYRGILQSVS